MKSGWLKEGFSLLKQYASYKRDYLMPRLNSDGGLERKRAGYGDAMVATAGLLGILGLPLAGLLDRAQRAVGATHCPFANGCRPAGQGPARALEAGGLRCIR